MTPQRARQIVEAWMDDTADHRKFDDLILAACAEERAKARREALTEAAKLIYDKSRSPVGDAETWAYYGACKIVALRDRKEPTK